MGTYSTYTNKDGEVLSTIKIGVPRTPWKCWWGKEILKEFIDLGYDKEPIKNYIKKYDELDTEYIKFNKIENLKVVDITANVTKNSLKDIKNYKEELLNKNLVVELIVNNVKTRITSEKYIYKIKNLADEYNVEVKFEDYRSYKMIKEGDKVKPKVEISVMGSKETLSIDDKYTVIGVSWEGHPHTSRESQRANNGYNILKLKGFGDYCFSAKKFKKVI